MSHVDSDAMPEAAGGARPEIGVAVVLAAALILMVGARRVFRAFT